MADSCVLLFGKFDHNVHSTQRQGDKSQRIRCSLTPFPAVPLRVCFRSGLGHQICQSQPAAIKALVDSDASCPKIQLDVARNALAETRW